MARPASTKPTDGEMQILRILWDEEGQTVRKVCEALGESADGDGPAYTSVHTRLLIMTNKGLVRKDENVRPARYYTEITEKNAKKHVFHELMNRFFRGSAADLVLHALRSEQLSAGERATIMEKLKSPKKSP